jgi:hypothetical protein
MADFYEIHQEFHATTDDLDAVIFNIEALTILKWRTFKLLRWIQNLHGLGI